jgi:hypothetical protein
MTEILSCDAEVLFPNIKVDTRPKFIIEDNGLRIDCWGVAEDPKNVPGCVMCLVKFLDNSPVAVRYQAYNVFKITYEPIGRNHLTRSIS